MTVSVVGLMSIYLYIYIENIYRYLFLPSAFEWVICCSLSIIFFVFFCVKAEGFSGADLAALLREAGLDVLRRLKNNEAVEGRGCTYFLGGGV